MALYTLHYIIGDSSPKKINYVIFTTVPFWALKVAMTFRNLSDFIKNTLFDYCLSSEWKAIINKTRSHK